MINGMIRPSIGPSELLPLPARGPLYPPPRGGSIVPFRVLPERLRNHTKAGRFSADRRGPRFWPPQTDPVPTDAPDCDFFAENTRFRGAAVPGAAQGRFSR